MEAVQLTKSQQNRLRKCLKETTNDIFVTGRYAISFCHLAPEDVREAGKEYILELVMRGQKKDDDIVYIGGALFDQSTLSGLLDLKGFKGYMEKMFNQMIADYIAAGAEDDD